MTWMVPVLVVPHCQQTRHNFLGVSSSICSQVPHWWVREKRMCAHTAIRSNTCAQLSLVPSGLFREHDEQDTHHLCLSSPCLQIAQNWLCFLCEEQFSLDTVQASSNYFSDASIR